jgi:hypothetical protein
VVTLGGGGEAPAVPACACVFAPTFGAWAVVPPVAPVEFQNLRLSNCAAALGTKGWVLIVNECTYTYTECRYRIDRSSLMGGYEPLPVKPKEYMY